MNMPQKYKYPEWKTYRLGDICTLNYGKALTATNRVAGNVPVYSSAGITGWHNMPLVQSRGIVVGRKGTVGNVYYSDKPFYCIDTAYYILPDDEKYDFKWLYYRLKSLHLDKLNEDSAVPGLNRETAYAQEFSLPSLEEQRRIAGILGAIDDKIENNRRINTNLELQAQALFDNLMSNSNLEYKLIADIDHIIETGRRPKGGVANITSGVPSIGAENIKGLGKYDYSKTKYITAEFAETLKKGIIKGYELLIYKDGGKPGYFIPNFSIFGEGFPYDNMTLNEHVFLLDFGNKGYNFFAYFYMQTEEVMKYLNAQGSKAAIPGINRNDVENISIPTIENEAVKEFCERIEPIITSILVNSKESSRLATLRDSLLPKLMNGEIKL
jgi:type I restriction enzyme S subunit